MNGVIPKCFVLFLYFPCWHNKILLQQWITFLLNQTPSLTPFWMSVSSYLTLEMCCGEYNTAFYAFSWSGWRGVLSFLGTRTFSFLSTSKYSISLLTFQLLNECESIRVFSLKAVIKSRQNDCIYVLCTHESNHYHKVYFQDVIQLISQTFLLNLKHKTMHYTITKFLHINTVHCAFFCRSTCIRLSI